MSRLRTRRDKNRKEKKHRYITLKNLMRKYPECSYGGDFFCNHVYDPNDPWEWVDFKFFHTKLKRYFSVAMMTCAYEAWEKMDNKALEIAFELFPKDDSDYQEPPTHRMLQRLHFYKKMRDDLLENPQYSTPTIMNLDYGPVAVGVMATVNKPYIDEHVIREFIAFFRSLGEPTKPGLIWRGEEIQIDPRQQRV